MEDETLCKHCKKPVRYVVAAASGKINILDAAPIKTGNVAIIDGLAHFHSKAAPLPDDATRYQSHFASCPFGERVRADLKARNEPRRRSWE